MQYPINTRYSEMMQYPIATRYFEMIQYPISTRYSEMMQYPITTQYSLHLAERFQRRRLTCKKLTDDGHQEKAKAHIAFGKVS